MFRVVTSWNFSRPNEEMGETVEKIELRGYKSETYLTGQFANKIMNEEIKPLSVSNISDRYCPTRRDLYFYKGVNRLKFVNQQETWGSKVGYIIEDYIERIFRNNSINNVSDEYVSLVNKGNNFHVKFLVKKSKRIQNLKNLETNSLGIEVGDTDWMLNLLNINARIEFGIKVLHCLLKRENSLDIMHVKKEKIRPNIIQIGINSPAVPDFIIPEYQIVGDIKTGVEFKPHFQLTCAGYALANENEKKEETNWGMIYFFPTRNPSVYVRPLTFPQIYIFPIDDYLRQWFLDIRDEAYNVILKNMPPDFPLKNKREHCKYCKFKDYCKTQGLELSNGE